MLNSAFSIQYCSTASAAPIELEQMALDGKVGLAGEAGQELVEGAALEGDDDAAARADDMVEVAGEAGHIAGLPGLCVDAGQPAGAAELLDGAIDGGATGRVDVLAEVGVEL